MKLKDVVMVSGVRTPIGDFGGSLKDVMGADLGILVAKEAMARAGVGPELIDDVLFGNCFMRSDEINVARVISLRAGIPFTTPAATIQRQCSSSMQAFAFGVQQIQCGECDVVLVGGVESMSNVPYVLKNARWGLRMKHAEVTDGLWEGLEDPIGHFMMGITAENLAEKYDISRLEQDELAATSHARAVAALESGRFKDELIPVPVPQRRGDPILFDTDEHPRPGLSVEKLSKLRAAFKKDGTVTAGNASGINDGASAAVIMSADKARELGLTPMARVVSHAVAGVEPELMGYGPVPASRKALKRAGLAVDDIPLWEINEAFAAQYLACEKLLELDRDKVNVNGSGVALGHPVGCTGLRVIVSLVHEMARRDLKLGAASLCVGGGMGKTVIMER